MTNIFSKRNNVILQSNGQWDDQFLPIYEPQAENYETQGCQIWGTQNAFEILTKRKYGFEPNFSERFNYILAGVRPPGSTAGKALQSVKRFGLIDASKLPVPATFEEFITPDPMSPDLLALGEKWLKEWDVDGTPLWNGSPKHEEKAELIKERLKYSPIGVSVTAWNATKEGEEIVYVDNGRTNNHFCVATGWNGLGWKVFDTYDHSQKIYSFNSKITVAYEYFLEKKKCGFFRKLFNQCT